MNISETGIRYESLIYTPCRNDWSEQKKDYLFETIM